MNREVVGAVAKLIAAAAVAVALLLVWVFRGYSWLGLVAVVVFVVVAALVARLISIDTGRVLRRHGLGGAATTATRIPPFVLGALACVAGISGIGLVMFGTFSAPWLRRGCALLSAGTLLYGISLLRREARTKGHVSS